jgi:hypothetical protein
MSAKEIDKGQIMNKSRKKSEMNLNSEIRFDKKTNTAFVPKKASVALRVLASACGWNVKIKRKDKK